MSLSSADPQRQSGLPAKTRLNISVIVPVLDEGALMRPFVEDLRQHAPSAEVIIVGIADSPSVSDAVTGLCDRVLTARRGRASQMNAGANAASGDIFWFVHADCEVPKNCLEQITHTLKDARIVGGCFRIRFPRRELIYRISDAGGNLAVELFGRCYGDHGIFCRREDFMAVGGYPDVPLLEDAEFYRRLRRRGQTQQLSSKIVTSPRRYEEIGPYRLTASYLLLSTLYLLRVPIPLLARIYNRLCLCADEGARIRRVINVT
jgi:rSAM/selenodomain-associated transferase 2